MSYRLTEHDRGDDNLTIVSPVISPVNAEMAAQAWIQSGYGVPKDLIRQAKFRKSVIFYPFTTFIIHIDAEYEVDVGRFNNSHYQIDLADWTRARERNNNFPTYPQPKKDDYYMWTHTGGHLRTEGYFNVVPMFYPSADETWTQYGSSMLKCAQSLNLDAIGRNQAKLAGVNPIIIKPFGIDEITNAYSAQISAIVTDKLRSQVKADKTENWSTDANYNLDIKKYYMIPFYRIDFTYKGTDYYVVTDCFKGDFSKGRRPRSGIAKILSIFGR